MVDFHSKLKVKHMDITDLSIDCESLGTRFDAPILSIGAVAFNRKTFELGKTFYAEIRLDSSLRAGCRPDAATIDWWMKQSPAARKIFDDSHEVASKRMGVADAMLNLCDFYRSCGTPYVWTNGIMSDIAWIEHSIYRGSVGISPPWNFRNVMEMRTLMLAASSVGFDKESVKRVGVEHNALDDAVHQAKQISAAWGVLIGTQKPTKQIVVPMGDDEF